LSIVRWSTLLSTPSSGSAVVSATDIFYSSGEDTGVPSGEDLNSYVREQVADAGLVIALVTRAFRTRPFCIAELGAAWSRVGNLFPLAMPGIDRTDLDGVLAGIAVRHMDDGAALDELRDPVAQVSGSPISAKTWGRYKQQWLANVDALVAGLPPVEHATLEELLRLRSDLEETRDALVDSEAQRRRLQGQVDALAEAKSAAEVADIVLPADEVERFRALANAASSAAYRLDSIVVEALWYEMVEDGMPWPDQIDESIRFDRAQSACRDRMLVESAADQLIPNDRIPDIVETQEGR
jgi:hypothetical protein